MAGIKRKTLADSSKSQATVKTKKPKTISSDRASADAAVKLPKKAAKKSKPEPEVEDDLIESDTSEDQNGFYGFSAKEDEEGDAPAHEPAHTHEPTRRQKALEEQDKAKRKDQYKDPNGHMLVSSKDAHAKQRALAKERKAAKPNADTIARSKKIWEQLRRKSHVSLEERKKLVEELFDIISGRIKEFVFKHDSVRVIQCALKYANQTQRKQIATELQGEFRALAESKYAKFLIAKLVVEGDREVKNMIIAEFFGHVKRLINHPEASWILDDIYRQVATVDQKARLLREWYGPEFALFKAKDDASAAASLAEILQESPEKRQPIVQHLHHLINQLIQKKLTGFTMLHDAILQYYLNCKPGTEEANEFLQLLQGQGDEEEKDFDLLKNLAFTASGSRVVCMAFAYGTAKDRRHLLKVYKDMLETLAHDQHAHNIFLTAYDVVDDTKGTFKAFYPELIGGKDDTRQQEAILEMANHPAARTTLLYPFAAATTSAGFPKWLLSAPEIAIMQQVHDLRGTTSKKDPTVRRHELIQSISAPLLSIIPTHAADLAASKNGCQYITELLLAGEGDKTAAFDAVAALVKGDPTDAEHFVNNAAQAKMVKTLVQGGHFDADLKQVHKVADTSAFCEKVYGRLEEVEKWATGTGAFTLVALLEQEEWSKRSELLGQLVKSKKAIKQEISKTEKEGKQSEEAEKKGKAKLAGMKLLLEKLG